MGRLLWASEGSFSAVVWLGRCGGGGQFSRA